MYRLTELSKEWQPGLVRRSQKSQTPNSWLDSSFNTIRRQPNSWNPRGNLSSFSRLLPTSTERSGDCTTTIRRQDVGACRNSSIILFSVLLNWSGLLWLFNRVSCTGAWLEMMSFPSKPATFNWPFFLTDSQSALALLFMVLAFLQPNFFWDIWALSDSLSSCESLKLLVGSRSCWSLRWLTGRLVRQNRINTFFRRCCTRC